MALIIDPDDLSQGLETPVSDMVFASAAGAQVDITSAGGNLPTLGVGEYFEVRDHSVAANNGLYVVDTVNTVNEDYTVTKQHGTNPSNAGSEAATVLGETGASTEKSVFFNTEDRTIWLLEQGNLSTDGVSLQALYSFAKEEWKVDDLLIAFDFPLVPITSEQFEFIRNWEVNDDPMRKLIRFAGWREIDSNNILKREYVGVVTLGTFEDTVNDLAYYQIGDDPTDITGATINFAFAGPVNEAIKTFEETIGPNASLNFNANNQVTRGSGSWITEGYRVGGHITIRNAEDAQNNGTFLITAMSATVITVSGTPFATNADDDTAVAAYNYRSAIKLFLRVRDGDPNGKTYSQASLADIGVTTLSYQTYRFPLSNQTDLKISETDANIAANSPYTEIQIRYLNAPYNREVDSVTKRDFGIIIDVGTYSMPNGVSNGTTLFTSAALSGITLADFTNGELIIHEGTDQGVHQIVGTPVDNGGVLEVTLSSPLSGSESSLSFTLQRATPVVATAEEIYEKIQYELRQAADIDASTPIVAGNTADELLAFVGDSMKAGSTFPSNPNGGGSGVFIEGFDSNDTNRLSFFDNGGTERQFPFVAAGSILFNDNLVNDGSAEYRMFFAYTERFTNTGFGLSSASGNTAVLDSSVTDLVAELSAGDYIRLNGFADSSLNGIYILTGAPAGTGPWTAAVRRVDGTTLANEAAGASVSLDKNPINSPDAIVVNDNDGFPIAGVIGGPSVGFDFDYDGNNQGGRTPGTDASIVIRAIGLETAQFVETSGTIIRAVGQTFSIVAALERTYSNV